MRRERSDLPPAVCVSYHAKRASHASLGEVHRCKVRLSLLLLRAVEKKLHTSVCLCTLSGLNLLAKSCSFSVSNSPYGNVLRRFRYEDSQEAYTFCVNPSVSCPGVESRFLPTKRRPNCMLESDMSRGRRAKTTTKLTAGECTPLASPPWLVRLTPLWTILNGNSGL